LHDEDASALEHVPLGRLAEVDRERAVEHDEDLLLHVIRVPLAACTRRITPDVRPRLRERVGEARDRAAGLVAARLPREVGRTKERVGHRTSMPTGALVAARDEAYDRLALSASVVGRDVELASIRHFVAGIPDGASTLVLEGEAGMGKTTLWRFGVETAESEGLVILAAQPAESETALSFSGLGDLLHSVLEAAMAPLPAGQRSALARAFVLEEVESPPPDAHAAGVAVLNALRGLAAQRDLLVAVDDVQWLDAASAAALAYAARRLKSEHVGLLLAFRSGTKSVLVNELRRVPRCGDVRVGSLDARALQQVVQNHLDVTLPRPLLAEVHHAAGGNPFYALEIVRMLQRSGLSVEAGKSLPVPDSLHELVDDRLSALPDESRHFLLAAAAHAHPTVSITERASGVEGTRGLTPALSAGVVELDGDRIRFTHPLLAAGVMESANPRERAEVHARLAELLEDPEARAWQLASSVDEPDERVAAALEEASARARARGAPRPAALLLDRSRDLTPTRDRDAALRRAAEAAFLHFESGDSRRAEEQLRPLIASVEAGPTRARALVRLARVRSYGTQREAADLFLQAIAEAAGDRATLAVAHEGVATCLVRLREDLAAAVEHAEHSARLARELGDDVLAAEAYGAKLLPEALLGRAAAATTASQALALQVHAIHARVIAQPAFPVAVYRWWIDDLGEARAMFIELLARAADVGDESSVPFVLLLLGHVEWTLGEIDSATLRANAGLRAAEQSAQESLLMYHLALTSRLAAQRGRIEEARELASTALELAPRTRVRPAELDVHEVLGQLDLVLGSPREALTQLEACTEFVRREAIVEPAETLFVVDHIEALVEVGRLDEAEELLGWYEGNARTLGRASGLACSARSRGRLAAADGRIEEAVAQFQQALEWHDRVPIPLDRGRTLLALGAAQRRLKRRREARATLDEALAIFERIDAVLWAERVRGELKRISGRAATPGALTPAEERVAALVAEGKTNKEVAAALFLSDRTVEGHLARIFGKLGIRQRHEVAGALQTRVVGASNTGDTPVSAGPPAP
jgi:DNA-binding CsgD family transcriptional regulator